MTMYGCHDDVWLSCCPAWAMRCIPNTKAVAENYLFVYLCKRPAVLEDNHCVPTSPIRRKIEQRLKQYQLVSSN